MPTLNWIGKDAVIRHHKDVPFRLLEADEKLSHGDGTEGNLIVEGDNLHALKALLPKYAGKVKCIYIDPPYNTGNEGWVYNDNVKSPEITKWLGEVVGKEAEDLSRHDKWLCMMYPRLVLLKQFLREDGAIFVSIDENEEHRLRLLLEEVFGESRFVCELIWKARQFNDSRSLTGVSKDHEKILVFSKSSSFEPFAGLPRSMEKFKNPDNDSRGPWMSRSILGLADKHARPNLHFEIKDPRTGWSFSPPENTGWRYSPETIETKIAKAEILFPKKPDGRPREKVFSSRMEGKSINFHSIIDDVFTAGGTKVIREIFSSDVFAFTKPPTLIQRLVMQVASDKDSIILDSFAGSGTTAHAVLKQNAEDGGNRKFILVEMEGEIAQTITAERVRRVAGGYTNSNGEEVEGLGSGFQYCRLSEEPLFNEFGDIRDDVTFAQLADFVWFSETGLGFVGASDSPLLGVHEGMAVYLLFNGILGDRRPQGGNILTKAILDDLPPHDGPKVIYAAATRLGSAALQRAQVVFKQTPYAIEV